MAPSPSRRTYQIIVATLALLMAVILGLVGLVLAVTRPPSARIVAATLAALPSPTPTLTPTPTPVPTLPGVTPALLLCQREASRAMNARHMVGAVNLSDDGLFLLKWVSLDWPVSDMDSALAGVIMGFDVALQVWEAECALYDRVQIEVYDRRQERETHQLTVRAQMDDLLKWQAGELDDRALLARLEVTRVDRPS